MKKFVKLNFFIFLAAAMMEQRVLGQDVQGEAGSQDAPVIPMFQVCYKNSIPWGGLKIPPH